MFRTGKLINELIATENFLKKKELFINQKLSLAHWFYRRRGQLKKKVRAA